VNEFRARLDEIGITPAEYARFSRRQRNGIGIRARGERPTNPEVLALLSILATYATAADRIRARIDA